MPSYNSLALNLNLTGKNASLFVKPTHSANPNNFYEKKHSNKAIIFNSEQEHYATNNDSENRVILYIDFDTNKKIGTTTKGLGIANKMGYPTINVNFTSNINYGIYECLATIHNKKYKGILFTDSNKYGEFHVTDNDTDYIPENSLIIFYGLNKIDPKSKVGIIHNYYRGCNNNSTIYKVLNMYADLFSSL